jgi:hypothetical protein
MDQSLIAWMIGGGGRHETREDQRRRQHLVALREADASTAGISLRGLVARWADRPRATAGVELTTDCCVA